VSPPVILAIMSFVFIFAQQFSAAVGADKCRHVTYTDGRRVGTRINNVWIALE